MTFYTLNSRVSTKSSPPVRDWKTILPPSDFCSQYINCHERPSGGLVNVLIQLGTALNGPFPYLLYEFYVTKSVDCWKILAKRGNKGVCWILFNRLRGGVSISTKCHSAKCLTYQTNYSSKSFISFIWDLCHSQLPRPESNATLGWFLCWGYCRWQYITRSVGIMGEYVSLCPHEFSRYEWNGWHFAYAIFKYIFLDILISRSCAPIYKGLVIEPLLYQHTVKQF